MPIKWKSKNGRRARLSTTLESVTGTIAGTLVVGGTFTGTISGLVYDFTGALTGLFVADNSVSGVISTTLANWTGNIYGTEDYPAFWSDGLSDTIPATAGVAFSQTFEVTDPDGDPITFVYDPPPSQITITEHAQVGNTRQLTISSDGTGLIAGDTYSVVIDLADASVSTAEQDWQSRISQPGVIWYHSFDTDAEVAAFHWSGGFSGGNDPLSLGSGATNLTRVATGGADGGGYLQYLQPAGTTTGQNSYWWRPFSPMTGASNGRGANDPGGSGAYNLRPDGSALSAQTFIASSGGSQLMNWAASARPSWYGHSSYGTADGKFDGTDFYVQVRVKTDPRRTRLNTDSGAYPAQATGKHVWLTCTEASYSLQEIVTNQKYTDSNVTQNAGISNFHNGYFGYSRSRGTGAAAQYMPWTDAATTGSGTRIQIGSAIPGVCDPYNSVNSGCWSFATDGTWDTLLYHVTPGRNDTLEGRLEVWAAHANQSSYTKILDVTYTQFFDQGGDNRNGWNAIILGGYNNGFTQPEEFWIGYDQVIFSKQAIALPAVGA